MTMELSGTVVWNAMLRAMKRKRILNVLLKRCVNQIILAKDVVNRHNTIGCIVKTAIPTLRGESGDVSVVMLLSPRNTHGNTVRNVVLKGYTKRRFTQYAPCVV